eukprot:2124847-Amphidinium_carterae.1
MVVKRNHNNCTSCTTEALGWWPCLRGGTPRVTQEERQLSQVRCGDRLDVLAADALTVFMSAWFDAQSSTICACSRTRDFHIAKHSSFRPNCFYVITD